MAQQIRERGRSGLQLQPNTPLIHQLLFADDIALLADTPRGLQNQLDILASAADEIGLTVNLDKTKVMVCRMGGYLAAKERWYFKGQRVDTVRTYKYLGFNITTKLSVNTALAEVAGRAKGKILTIFRILYRLGRIDIDLFFKLFDTQIKPTLLYASEVWGLTKYKVIENVHAFACKKLLGVSLKTPTTMVYGELGRYPLFIDSVARACKYWTKLTTLDNHRLPKLAYCRDRDQLSNTRGWATQLKDILTRNGFAYLWEGGLGVIPHYYAKVIKQRLIDQYKQQWHTDIENSDRYSTFRTFKHEHKREQYLTEIKVAKYRKLFTRMRLGITELNNNKVHTQPDKPRTCPFCNVIEDEEHFLLACPKYNHLRHRYITRHWITLNTVQPKDLLNDLYPHISLSVALYTDRALKRREQLIQQVTPTQPQTHIHT